MATFHTLPPPPDDLNRDLGFGSVVSQKSRQRLLNKDGSFNVAREGLHFLESLSPYNFLITTSWPRFLGLIVLFYLVVNLVFGADYYLCGPGEIAGMTATTPGHRFLEGFFFSVQTFATIGYGAMYPVSLKANLLVSLESLVGLLGFALATGILFARFAQPTPRILFSRQAIIAPYRQITAFQFRIANMRRHEMIQVEAQVTFTRLKEDGSGSREFIVLSLEREKVVFFPLAWTIVHPIDETSPLYGMTPEDLMKCETEFLILLSGIDDVSYQTVHTRSSYKPDEIVWGARFANLFVAPKPGGALRVDLSRLHEIERARLPPAV